MSSGLNKPGLVQTSGENLVFKYLYDNILDWLTLTFSGKGEMILILASFSPADLFCHFLGGVLKSFRKDRKFRPTDS